MCSCEKKEEPNLNFSDINSYIGIWQLEKSIIGTKCSDASIYEIKEYNGFPCLPNADSKQMVVNLTMEITDKETGAKTIAEVLPYGVYEPFDMSKCIVNNEIVSHLQKINATVNISVPTLGDTRYVISGYDRLYFASENLGIMTRVTKNQIVCVSFPISNNIDNTNSEEKNEENDDINVGIGDVIADGRTIEDTFVIEYFKRQ